MDDPRTTFWASNWQHGYIGVQWLESSQRVLFSVWDATEAESGETGGTYCQPFGGEGVGWSCRSEGFEWRTGVIYTLRTERRGAWIHGSISGEGRALHLGRIKAPHLSSLGFFANNFIEQFGFGVTCQAAPQASAIFYPPRGDGKTARDVRGLVNETCPRGFVTQHGAGSYVRFGGDDNALSQGDKQTIAALLAKGRTRHSIPYLPSADTLWHRSFIRVANHSALAGDVLLRAVDDAGELADPVTLELGAEAAARITATDLEFGNIEKRLLGNAGAGQGDWRVHLTSGLDIEARSYVHTPDGLVAPLHDLVSGDGSGRRARISTFNPGNDRDRVSKLRLTNPSAEEVGVFVKGIDDTGQSPGMGVRLRIPSGATRNYTSAQLETGGTQGLEGSLGDGHGLWRLTIESDAPIRIMNLTESARHLTNMSSGDGAENGVSVTTPPRPFDAVLPPVELGSQGNTIRIALASLFVGEYPLTFTARSSDPSLVAVEAVDGVLIVRSVAEGEDVDVTSVTVTVTATDAGGWSGTLTFEVDTGHAPRSLLRGWRRAWIELIRGKAGEGG